MRILFIVPYPEKRAASQRFRFEQYFSLLQRNNIEYDISPFMDDETWDIIYKSGFLWRKIAGILRGYFRRLINFFSLHKYDYIFVHREVFPFGLPFLTWVMCKASGKKVIFDFDDAIWIPNASDTNKFMYFFKFYSNTRKLCKWAYKVSCGNEYLMEFARKYNSNVIYNPTTIDTENYHNKVKQHFQDKFVIGWTGTHSTIQYLNDLLPLFQELEREFDFELQVISDKKPSFQLKSLRYKPWNKSTEIKDLLEFSVGLMPLSDDKWAQGKCGFKALQYMALGIPALVSPVGVNTKIVDNGLNGFVCRTPEEWKINLRRVLTDKDLLLFLSTNTRKKIIDCYSVKSNSQNFLNLFT